MRENARCPWRVDCITNPSRDGRWVSRRDESLEADLEDVTWVAGDGIRYLNPEVALLFKGRQKRLKDEVDLGNALPLMTPQQRDWLSAHLRSTYGDAHPWLPRLSRNLV
jgi:hypothetical protein